MLVLSFGRIEDQYAYCVNNISLSTLQTLQLSPLYIYKFITLINLKVIPFKIIYCELLCLKARQ